MAFFGKFGNIVKQTASKQLNGQISLSSPSIFQAIRCMSSSKLFVGGISYSTDEQSLGEAFSKYGEVVEARVIVDRETGRSRGFGFITYTSTEEASSAIQALDGQDLHGRRIRVNYANDRSGGFRGSGFGGNYGPPGGGYGGGAGGYGAGAGGYEGGAGGYGGDASGYGGGAGYGGGNAGDNYVQSGSGGGYGGDNQFTGSNQFGSNTQFGNDFGGNNQFDPSNSSSDGQFSSGFGSGNQFGGDDQFGSMENNMKMDDEPTTAGDWKDDENDANDDTNVAKRA